MSSTQIKALRESIQRTRSKLELDEEALESLEAARTVSAGSISLVGTARLVLLKIGVRQYQVFYIDNGDRYAGSFYGSGADRFVKPESLSNILGTTVWEVQGNISDLGFASDFSD